MDQDLKAHSLSPVVVFAFNRPEALFQTLEALKKNPEAKDTLLHIFVDGPRIGNEKDKVKVAESKQIASETTGFAKIVTHFSEENKGLGPSVISGVSQVLEQHDRAIILEDDLIVLPNFLSFMNEMFIKYKSEQSIWSVCGYTNRIKVPMDYPYDVYFAPRSSSWGWGTWSDRWNSIDWTFEKWNEWRHLKHDFNRWGGSDCFSMLNGCRIGKNKSWAIRFSFNQFLQNKLALFPVKSLVINDGFDGQGTNCKKYSRFKYDLMDENKVEFRLPGKIERNKKICNQALSYNGLMIRIWSRLMYLIKG